MEGRGFSPNAKQILLNANSEALRLKSNIIVEGHFLLAMLRIKSCEAMQVIAQKVDDLSEFKDKLENLIANFIPKDIDLPTSEGLPMALSANRMLQLACLEAGKTKGSKVGSLHILAAITRLTGPNIFKQLLNQYDINIDNIYDNLPKSSDPDTTDELIISVEQMDIEDLTEKKENSKQRPIFAEHKKMKDSQRYLQQFGKNLSVMAQEGKLDPVIGREDIIERVAQVLARRKKNNPILIGEAGVGKTAIAEGLAICINEKRVPYCLYNKQIFVLDLAAVVAGTKYRGQFEERLKGLINELKDNEDLILFIDEIHTLVGAGSSEGGLDASNILKPILARGELQCIGATTIKEYRKYFAADSALDRRFQQILINPTTIQQTIEILNNIKSYYQDFHKVEYTQQAIEQCVILSDRYINERVLPDKAIDLLDEAGARAKVKKNVPTKQMQDKIKEIDDLKKQINQAVENRQFSVADNLKKRIEDLIQVYNKLKSTWQDNMSKHPITVNQNDIAKVVSYITGIPIEKLSQQNTEQLLDIDKQLKYKIIGQDEAIDKICKTIRRSRVGLKDPNKPIGSFMFVGPTGVGKTYLVKTLADCLFANKENLIRIDMSEYMEKFNVSRLIGSAPGYIGYQEGGQLTEQVRLHPYSIILLDEIEKANKDVFNILLQIMDEGRLTDSMGRTIDFKNTIIVMTSNVGSRTLQDFGTGAGFSNQNRQSEQKKLQQNVIDKDIQKTFAPEFLNRIDDIVFFNALANEDLLKILNLELKNLIARVDNVGYKLNITSGAKQFILDTDINRSYGARPIKRAIETYIEDPLGEVILKDMSNKQNSKTSDDVSSTKKTITIKQSAKDKCKLEFKINTLDKIENDTKLHKIHKTD